MGTAENAIAKQQELAAVREVAVDRDVAAGMYLVERVQERVIELVETCDYEHLHYNSNDHLKQLFVGRLPDNWLGNVEELSEYGAKVLVVQATP